MENAQAKPQSNAPAFSQQLESIFLGVCWKVCCRLTSEKSRKELIKH